MKHFIFDVDGTLTPSRKNITPEFEKFFLNFCKNNKCHVVTGSDNPKTISQLGKEICKELITIYNCSGNDVWFRGNRVYTNDWQMSKDLRSVLEDWLNKSPFRLRTGNHIEERIGTLNFSVVGRNANDDERSEYIRYNHKTNERFEIAKDINNKFPDLEASLGGETGVDIYPKGLSKAQVINDFGGHELYFFGDQMDVDGNDYPLRKAILDNKMGQCYHVKDYVETWAILRKICNEE